MFWAVFLVLGWFQYQLEPVWLSLCWEAHGVGASEVPVPNTGRVVLRGIVEAQRQLCMCGIFMLPRKFKVLGWCLLAVR